MSDRQLSFDNIVTATFESASVAQPVEQGTHYPKVAGSMPARRIVPQQKAKEWEPQPPGKFWEKYFKSVSPKRPFVLLASLVASGTTQEQEYEKQMGRPWRKLPEKHPFAQEIKAKLTGNKTNQKQQAQKWSTS